MVIENSIHVTIKKRKITVNSRVAKLTFFTMKEFTHSIQGGQSKTVQEGVQFCMRK